MERTLEQALGNAGRISAELPDLLQPTNEDHDMILLASEVCVLRDKLTLAHIEASSLALWLWKIHWKDESPNFELCDSVEGIISQIDNMVCSLKKPD
ncbi:hypothetical protein CI610_01754 [invertebrate metagenome]|uniref:Uncharacterized protein n=1 Tax=invertebrate metagenome TaxID=1711999 RepID=A0A2H9T7X4_9ZZZZ